jgi:hypothetical protein
MARRILIGGIVAGVLLFLWGGLYHDFLSFGEIGLKELPNEQALLTVTKANIPEAGMYLFPTTGLPANATHAERMAKMEEVNKKAASGPQGVLIYHPIGAPLSARMLLTECSTNIIQGLLVAFLLAQAGVRRFASRLGLAFVIGLVAAITTNVSLWNWYGFPSSWIISNMVFLVIGYFLVGIVTAAIVKTSAPKAAAAAV